MVTRDRNRKKIARRRKIILVSVLSLFLIVSCILSVSIFYKIKGDSPFSSKNEETAEISEDKLLENATNDIAHNTKIAKVKVKLNKKKEVPEGVKLVAITFDDGPGYKSTQMILDTLKKYKAKGTWFVLGTGVENNPEMLKQIDKAGHEINSHTYDHPDLTTLSAEQIKWQINTTNTLIYNAIKKDHPIYVLLMERIMILW